MSRIEAFVFASALAILASSPRAQLANDNCTGAAPISDGLTSGTNVGATTDSPDSCGMDVDVWYTYQATCSGQATASFCTSGAFANFDVVLAAFSGSCGALVELACNDDTCGLDSAVQFPVVAGQAYYVAVGGLSPSDQGPFALSMSCVLPPANDDCSGALPIADGLTSGTNMLATNSSPSGNCGVSNDLWYLYQAPCSGLALASFCAPGASANFDATLAAFSGSCGALTQINCNSHGCGSNAQLEFPVTAGQLYYVEVGGHFSGDQGNFTLSMSCVLPPANDACSGALPIADGLTSGTNILATNSSPTGNCGMTDDVWYLYQAPCTGQVTASFCKPGAGSSFTSTLAAFSGSCSALAQVACDNFSCGSGSEIQFQASAGQQYYIAVGSYSGSGDGSFTLSLSCMPPPANDNCAGALPVVEGLTSGSNMAATDSAPTGSCGMQRDVWFTYQPACSGTVVASLCGPAGSATFDAALAAFSGSCSGLNEVVCKQDSCGSNPEISFFAAAGQSYYVAVGADTFSSASQGDFTLSLSCSATPTNDVCSAAIPVTDGLTQGTNVGATTSPQPSNCPMQYDVWYAYQATCTGQATASLCDAGGSANFNTVLTCYSGACAALGAVTCDENSCSNQSKITFPIASGEIYFIRLGGSTNLFGGEIAQGTFTLSIACTPAPSNDECMAAIAIVDGLTAGSTIAATTSRPTGSCGMQKDVWYAYQAPCTGTVTVSLCGAGTTADFDTILAAFAGSCGALNQIACNDESCGGRSKIGFFANAGQVYYIAVGGAADLFGGTTSQGTFTFSLSCAPTPTNDECSGATAIGDGLTLGSNFGATSSPSGASCGIQDDVWYIYQSTCSGEVAASFCGPAGTADFDTVLAAYTQGCGALTLLQCNDDFCSSRSQLSFTSTPGQSYYIRVGGSTSLFGSDVAQGNFSLSMSCVPAPVNDDCTGALPIADGLTVGSTVAATNSSPSGSCGVFNDLWYLYQAPCSGLAVASFCAPGASANFDVALSAFSGSCGALIQLACNDDTCGLRSEVQFPAVAGQTYYVEVGGHFSSAQGNFTLSMSCPAPPVNDNCAGALPITNGLTAGTTLLATSSFPTGNCGSMGSDIWYAYLPTCTGTATASFCKPGATANFNTVLAAFSGGCASLTQLACNNDSCGSRSEIAFPVTAGQPYFIAVGGASGAQGSFTLSLDCPDPPAGDECTTAAPIALGLTSGTNVGATTSALAANCSSLGHEVWYSYEAACTGEITASFCQPGSAANFLTALAAFSGSCGALTQLACASFTCFPQTEIHFPVTAGQTYYLAVGGAFDFEGTYTLALSCAPAKWISNVPLPLAVTGAAAAVVDDRIYASHGFSPIGYTAALGIYDIASKTWSVGPPAGVARASLGGASAAGKYYAIGGVLTDGSVTGAMEVYDPVTSSWSVGPSMPTPRAGLAVAVLGERIHAIGGQGSVSAQAGPVLAVHEVYDPNSNSWTARAPLPVAVGDATAAVAVGGKIYVCGGYDGNAVIGLTQVYLPASDTWSLGVSMPTARSAAVAGAFEYGALAGKPVVAGGRLSSGLSSNAVEIYDPAADVWTSGPQKPTAAEHSAAAAPSTCGALHMLGGGAGATFLMQHETLVATESLSAQLCSISLASGGVQEFELQTAAASAGQAYLLMGSASGTSPGVLVDGLLLPLNPDAYTLVTLIYPNLGPYSNFQGLLGPDGSAVLPVVITVPPGSAPALAGTLLQHAYVVLDAGAAVVAFVSNALPLTLKP